MLYVGTNYHPQDWPKERWITDIESMRKASFNIVRLGHLCWDSFEPSEGNYSFEWFDDVMELFTEAGIQVVLDIATRPAPTWLHKKYPDIGITNESGMRLNPQTRYMEDVGHPAFREYAYRFAENLVQRYKHHPALLAFGLCNELGAGFVSYSGHAKERFVSWLQKRYGTIAELNKAWASHRWSRRLSSYQDVVLPVSGTVKGSPERQLDMWRFYSDETLDYLKGLSALVKRLAPNVRESTNHWGENPELGFDYLKAYKEIFDIPGVGFYPGTNPEDRNALIGACFTMNHRLGELEEPIWCLEFQTGTFGGYGSPKQAMRMYAYLALIYKAQMVCAWTWRSMLGGEEQYLFGLLDHDGVPGRKYEEFKQFSEEFRLLESKGFPRKAATPIAIAYSFESLKVMEANRSFYKTDYKEQVLNAYQVLFEDNQDCRIVNVGSSQLSYKLLIIPGHAVMDEVSADNIRSFVANGGTVVMTAYSAKVNAYNQVFDSMLPGGLSDVFGIRVGAFERAKSHTPIENEGGFKKSEVNVVRAHPGIHFRDQNYKLDIDYYEIVQLLTAKVTATITNIGEPIPAITRNAYGKGEAIYLAIPADPIILQPLLQELYRSLDIQTGPITPSGVVARQLDETSWLYINTTGSQQTVCLELEGVHGLITNSRYQSELVLEAYQVELVDLVN